MYQSVYYDREEYQYYLRDDKRGWKVFKYQPTYYVAHELVHHKQNLEGRITNPEIDGADGSEIENEANAVAGVIIRKWGRIHPEIYE